VDTSPLLQNNHLKNQRSIDEHKLKVRFLIYYTYILYMKDSFVIQLCIYICHIMTFLFAGFEVELYNSKGRICRVAERSNDSC